MNQKKKIWNLLNKIRSIMREPKKVYEYCDRDTCFETTDKELALIVFEHARKKDKTSFDGEIASLKESIKEDNGAKK